MHACRSTLEDPTPLCRYAEHALGTGVASFVLTTMADAASLIDDIVAGEPVDEDAVALMRTRIAALPPIERELREDATVVLDRSPTERAAAFEEEESSADAVLHEPQAGETPTGEDVAPPVVEAPASLEEIPGEPALEAAAAAADEAAFADETHWFEPPAETPAESLDDLLESEPVEAPAPAAAESTEAVEEAEAFAAAETVEAEEAYDPEIALIFADEAGELLERADAALALWRSHPAEREPLQELQRVLHTLKGGARMAGLARVGTAAHDLETLLTDVAASRQPPASELLALVQHTIDRMHGVHEQLTTGRPLGPLQDLIDRIRRMSGRPAEAEAAEEAVVEAPAPVEPDAAELVAASEPEVEEIAEEAPAAIEEPPPEEIAEAPLVEEPVAEDEEPVPAWTADTVEEVEEVAEEAAAAPEPEAPREVVAPPPVTPPAVAAPPPVATPLWIPRTEPERVAPAATAPEREPREVARVDAALLESLLNNAGEISIFRARLEQQVSSIEFNLGELSQTVTRLREQMRKLELETEAQIRFRHQDEDERHRDFDPLELDRYSTIQQLSRALAESLSDLTSIQELMGDVSQDSQGLLVQQARVTTELQDGLMRTRMVPFSQHSQRLSRIVRQTALETGKLAELHIEGASGELDRQVLERMLPPFEHMMRNAVVHGVETVDERRAAGKPEIARIGIALRREGSQVVIDVTDDGAGLDVATIKEKAHELGMLDPTATLTDSDALQLILQPGFSTASRVTEAAGRGVGMDVVANEVRQLGGSLDVRSQRGVGTHFTIRLPFTLAITQALLVRAAEELYAIPLPTVEGIVRIPARELSQYLEPDAAPFVYGGQGYRFRHLGALLGTSPAHVADGGPPVPVILVSAGEHSSALVAEDMLGSREVVVKSVGPQIAAVRGVSGATILGDGSIAIILDITALVRGGPAVRHAEAGPARGAGDERPLALVVDDSITVRRVTQRLLERHGLRVQTAKDGIDAIALMQEHVPDVLVLDIEMPRMDGYEVVAYVRNDDRLARVPIVMVTSRVGQKHRAHGLALGVNEYLGKPYQEKDLLGAIERFLAARERAGHG